MLDLPDAAMIDKDLLVGGCVRLPLRVDPVRLAAEFDGLPADVWGTAGGRVGVHRAAEALFLRGYAPAEGEKPIEDRPLLKRVPYMEHVLRALIPASPLRCLLAKLPGGASIAPHIDRAPYFGKTLRLHVPVITHERAWMICAGLAYRMAAGEVWALNNSTVHAVWNAHPQRSRTHLICDYLPTSALLDLLRHGERGLGCRNAEVEAHFAALSVPAPAVT